MRILEHLQSLQFAVTADECILFFDENPLPTRKLTIILKLYYARNFSLALAPLGSLSCTVGAASSRRPF